MFYRRSIASSLSLFRRATASSRLQFSSCLHQRSQFSPLSSSYSPPQAGHHSPLSYISNRVSMVLLSALCRATIISWLVIVFFLFKEYAVVVALATESTWATVLDCGEIRFPRWWCGATLRQPNCVIEKFFPSFCVEHR